MQDLQPLRSLRIIAFGLYLVERIARPNLLQIGTSVL